jgi:hypothetical protein
VCSVANVASQADWFASDVKLYPVIVALDEPFSGLRPGMSAAVVITTGVQKGVLVVPVQAVVAKAGQKFCYVKKGDDVEKRQVATGQSTERYVEIARGLQEGDEVLVNPGGAGPSSPDASGAQAPRRAQPDLIIVSVQPASPAVSRTNRITRYGLTRQDHQRLLTLGTVARAVPVRSFPAEIRHLERSHLGRLVATEPDYLEMFSLDLAAGRFLVDEDGKHMRNVVVLGSAMAGALFAGTDPLGQTVRIGQHFYTVVGVIRERAPVRNGKEVVDYNSAVYLTLETCQARFGERVLPRTPGAFTAEAVELSQVLITLRDPKDTASSAAVIAEQLQQAHIKKDWDIQPAKPSGAP